MSTLFQKAVPVVVNVDNKALPTSLFFVGGEITKVGTVIGVQEVWTDKPVTEKVALNSNFLSGQVKLNFHHLARDSNPSDEKEFQKLEFTHLSQALEISANLIKEGKVERRKDRIDPEVYIMYTKDANLMFYNGLHGWQFYYQPKEKHFKTFNLSMYEIGKHCTVISLA